MNKQLCITLLLLTANLQFASQIPPVALQPGLANNSVQPDDGRSPRQGIDQQAMFLMAMQSRNLALNQLRLANPEKAQSLADSEKEQK